MQSARRFKDHVDFINEVDYSGLLFSGVRQNRKSTALLAAPTSRSVKVENLASRNRLSKIISYTFYADFYQTWQHEASLPWICTTISPRDSCIKIEVSLFRELSSRQLQAGVPNRLSARGPESRWRPRKIRDAWLFQGLGEIMSFCMGAPAERHDGTAPTPTILTLHSRSRVNLQRCHIYILFGSQAAYHTFCGITAVDPWGEHHYDSLVLR